MLVIKGYAVFKSGCTQSRQPIENMNKWEDGSEETRRRKRDRRLLILENYSLDRATRESRENSDLETSLLEERIAFAERHLEERIAFDERHTEKRNALHARQDIKKDTCLHELNNELIENQVGDLYHDANGNETSDVYHDSNGNETSDLYHDSNGNETGDLYHDANGNETGGGLERAIQHSFEDIMEAQEGRQPAQAGRHYPRDAGLPSDDSRQNNGASSAESRMLGNIRRGTAGRNPQKPHSRP